MSKLYHKDVYIADKHKKPCWGGTLNYTRHAIASSQNDRYGKIELPNKIDYNYASLIEVEVDNDIVVKQVWRTTYDATRDLVLVITNAGFVKTVWINVLNDKHTTLDVSKYNIE